MFYVIDDQDLLLDDSYMLWLEKYITKHIALVFNYKAYSSNEVPDENIIKFRDFYLGIQDYAEEYLVRPYTQKEPPLNQFYLIKFKNKIYRIGNQGNSYYCYVVNANPLKAIDFMRIVAEKSPSMATSIKKAAHDASLCCILGAIEVSYRMNRLTEKILGNGYY